MSRLFVSETNKKRNISQQYKILEHSGGTLGSLAYIINPTIKLLSQLYWFLTCFVFCDFWQYFVLHLSHKRYLRLIPGRLFYMAKETLNVQPKLRIFRWGDSLALPRSAKIVITVFLSQSIGNADPLNSLTAGLGKDHEVVIISAGAQLPNL